MSGSFDRLVDGIHRGRSAVDLADSSPDALLGVSPGDARHLAAAFGIATIGDMARSPVFRAACVIASAASGTPAFDPGPPPDWEARFAAAPLDAYKARPDLFRLDFGPVFYRGRLDGTARLLVVGQDPSVNEILAQRAFVGQSGQRLQGFLAKLGLTRSYLMLNTFLFSVFGQFEGPLKDISARQPILSYRNALFDAAAAGNAFGAVLTVGVGARDAVARWPGGAALPRTHILHPAVPNTTQLLGNWNQGLEDLRPVLSPDDGAVPGGLYGDDFRLDDIIPIPPVDLPFGLPAWHGKGDHAVRAGNDVIEWHSQPV